MEIDCLTFGLFFVRMDLVVAFQGIDIDRMDTGTCFEYVQVCPSLYGDVLMNP